MSAPGTREARKRDIGRGERGPNLHKNAVGIWEGAWGIWEGSPKQHLFLRHRRLCQEKVSSAAIHYLKMG